MRSPGEDAGNNAHRMVAPPPMSYAKGDADGGEQRGKMLYAYQATGEGEITVSDGQEFTLLDPDGKYPITLIYFTSHH